MQLTNLTDEQVIGLWGGTMRELRRRGLIRTWNSPVAEYAEWLVAHRLNLTLATNSSPGFDAVDHDGTRYQVKARRLTGSPGDRQLGVIRNIDERGFDQLVVVFFDQDLGLKEMWRLPFDLVREKAVYNRHQNGHVLHVNTSVLNDPRAERMPRAPDTQPQSHLTQPEGIAVEQVTHPSDGHDGGARSRSAGMERLNRHLVREKVTERLRLRSVPDSEYGYTALDDDGARYVIRSRTVGSAMDRELSVIKNIDQKQFDYLVVVLFDRASNEYRMWRLRFDLVVEHAKYDPINKGHVLVASDLVLSDCRAERL